jgi:hypothetical protein
VGPALEFPRADFWDGADEALELAISERAGELQLAQHSLGALALEHDTAPGLDRLGLLGVIGSM